MANIPDHEDLVDIGKSIIAQVKSVFVFGSGNKLPSDKDYIRTGGWSSTIQGTSRAPHTYLPDPTDEKKLTLQKVGDMYAGSNAVLLHANMTGLAMAARIGNCHENAALALYFCLQRKDIKGDPIFSKVSIVAYKGYHAFVKAETKNGDVVYIDPWNSWCFGDRDFIQHYPPGGLGEAGNTRRYLETLLQVLANKSEVPSKTTVPNIFIDKEEYLDECQLAIEKHLRALNIHPKYMDYYLDSEKYYDLKRRYPNNDFRDIYKNFIDKLQLAAKERVLRQIRDPLARERLRKVKDPSQEEDPSQPKNSTTPRNPTLPRKDRHH